jgi:hypothetical protein
MRERVARLWTFDPVEGVSALLTLALCIDVLVAVCPQDPSWNSLRGLKGGGSLDPYL